MAGVKKERAQSREQLEREREAQRFIPTRTTHCTCCLSLIDPSPETLAANPDLSDDAGNLYCNSMCKRIYKAGDYAAIEQHRIQVRAGELDAFTGGLGLVSTVTL